MFICQRNDDTGYIGQIVVNSFDIEETLEVTQVREFTSLLID